MKIEFQEDLLKFLLQFKEAKDYVIILDSDVFDLDTYRFIFSTLKDFVKEYKSIPSKGNLLEHFDREIKKSKFKGEDLGEIAEALEEMIKDLYIPFTGNIQQIKDIIIEEYQLKRLRELFIEKSSKLNGDTEDIVNQVFKEVSDIKQLAENDLNEQANKGYFALADYGTRSKKRLDVVPTYLHGLNRLTGTGGFYAPQLNIFIGGPKSFKTGTALSLAINFVRAGKKVYYVDCENGEDRIVDRFYQGMLQATYEEMISGELDEIQSEMVERFKVLGGDFLSDFYPAHTKSTADVETRLNELKTSLNWTPDIIFWDYPDLMKPEDYRIKDKRLQIQAVYFDIIRLHKRWKIFGFGLSQVNRFASKQAHRDETAFAEDFGKAANAHSTFSLERDEDELEAGVMRISPVLQRDGVPAHKKRACFVEVDEGRMLINEISKEEWEERVLAVRAAKKPEKTTQTQGKKLSLKQRNSLKDE